ncbi:MAG: type VI secretion system ImpA family N-terminal domain-containing protein [Burkholderiales bacterium]|jgi:type VI secretion system protein ImpA|nr:type VI secretion system ImpA family N-terminal domain-containing protein [Burkholderiales bacterium]
MTFSFITEPCSPENAAGQDLSGSSQWLELEQMQSTEKDDFAEGIWSVSAPDTDWQAIAKVCMKLLREDTKDLQVMVWWVRARLLTDGLPGLQEGMEGLHCWIKHWWIKGYPQDLRNGPAIKLGRLRWLDQHCSDLIQTQYQPSPADEESAQAIRTLIHDIETLVQSTTAQAWGLFTKTMEKLPVRIKREATRKAEATAPFPPSPLVSPLKADTQPSERLQTPANRQNAVQNIEQALFYFEQHEPQHPVKAMLQRALTWMNKPMDQWLSELVSDEPSRKKIQDVLGLTLAPSTPKDN